LIPPLKMFVRCIYRYSCINDVEADERTASRLGSACRSLGRSLEASAFVQPVEDIRYSSP
jgi:hypothetical protein